MLPHHTLKMENAMKNLLISTAILGGLALPAVAQDTMFRSEMSANAVQASDLVGARIYASDVAVDADAYDGVQEGWNDIGEVNDVIISRDGTVEAVLVDIGGFLGIGERAAAVDMTALRFVSDTATPDDEGDWFLVMNADRAALEAAPEWTMSMDTPAADTAVADDAATDVTTTDPTAADTMREATVRDGYAAVTSTDLTSELLVGANVYDGTDKDIGTVADLVLSADGQITSAIIDVGGFLGMGEKPVEVMIGDMDILQQTDGTDVRVYLPQTKEQLEAMPAYTN
jgi:sporulation protein YlmC with PRC-barrel domain